MRLAVALLAFAIPALCQLADLPADLPGTDRVEVNNRRLLGDSHPDHFASAPSGSGHCHRDNQCKRFEFCKYGTCQKKPGYCENRRHCKAGFKCQDHFCVKEKCKARECPSGRCKDKYECEPLRKCKAYECPSGRCKDKYNCEPQKKCKAHECPSGRCKDKYHCEPRKKCKARECPSGRCKDTYHCEPKHKGGHEQHGHKI